MGRRAFFPPKIRPFCRPADAAATWGCGTEGHSSWDPQRGAAPRDRPAKRARALSVVYPSQAKEGVTTPCLQSTAFLALFLEKGWLPKAHARGAYGRASFLVGIGR